MGRLVYSYTSLHLYESICPWQMYRRYIKKDLPFVESEAMKWGNEVHSAMEKRVGDCTPLPKNMEQWEGFASALDGAKAEQKLAVDENGFPVDFFSDKAFFRGKIDAAIARGSTAYILDWKTGSSKYVTPFELETNAVLLHAANPHLRSIHGQYCFLKENQMGELYDLSDTRHTWNVINDIVAAIEKSEENDKWQKKPSGLCGWCTVRDCEHNRANA